MGKRTGEDIWPTLDTRTAARDLETARVALGEGKINYYGLSWGNQRGQEYIKLFPNDIRTMIFDGVVDHTLSFEPLAMNQAVGFGLAAKYFFEWAKTNQSSALYGQDGEQIFGDLVAQAAQAPLEVPERTQSGACLPQITEFMLRSGLAAALDHEFTFPLAAINLAAAATGNFSAWATTLPIPEESSYYNTPAIWCNDWHYPTTYTEFIGLLDATKALSNLNFNPLISTTQYMSVCPRWPAKVVDPPAPLNIANISAPILLVNAFRDGSTGYDAAVRLKAQLPGSVILSRDGARHGSFFPALPTPAADIMMDYVITGKPPADWTVVPSEYWQMPYNVTRSAGPM